MGTSGSGSGGGGSGGAGKGGGGSRGGGSRRDTYGDYASSNSDPSDKPEKRNVAQKVLGSLKPAYLIQQFAGCMSSGLVHELVLLKVDIILNRSWEGMCARLGLPANASPADVCEQIITKQAEGESDARIRETATATVLAFFDELCRFDEEVLYGIGSSAKLDALDRSVIDRPLESFLRLHYVNVLLREEPKILNPVSQTGLENLAASMASDLVRRLRNRYGSKDQSSEGDFLTRAATNDKEQKWLLEAIRG